VAKQYRMLIFVGLFPQKSPAVRGKTPILYVKRDIDTKRPARETWWEWQSGAEAYIRYFGLFWHIIWLFWRILDLYERPELSSGLSYRSLLKYCMALLTDYWPVEYALSVPACICKEALWWLAKEPNNRSKETCVHQKRPIQETY